MMLSRMFRTSSQVGAALGLACATFAAGAQTSGVGNINGTLTDASGAVVAGAGVVVTNTDTGIVRTLTTNRDGSYAATFLLPGHYDVVLGGGSFGKVDRKGLVVTVGQVLTLDVALPPASVTTEVQVTSESPLIDTDKTEVSQTVDQTLISNLPVNARNWSDFVLLTPNVVQDGGSGLVAFHGISGLYNQNYVDGANNNQMLFSEARGRASGAPFVYSLDSIKEFQAETSNYSVEFGQAAGGQVNAITKSGTNTLHGDLFYYLRYPSLNALDPFSKYQALHAGGNAFLLTQPVHQQQEFGGSVGLPILHDRLFFFGTYDGFRKVGKALYSDTNTISLTPSGATTNTSTVTPTQCPATITAAQCASAIQFILTNANQAPSRFAKENLFFPRLDFHVNSRNDLFVNFNFADYDSTNGYSPAPTFTNSSPSTNGQTSYHERFLVGGLTTQIGSKSVNQIHSQYGRDLETAGSNAPAPSVATGVFTYGQPNALPRVAEPDEHRFQFTDVFSTTRGHHTLKAGGDVNIVHEVMVNLFQGGGVYAYGLSNPTANFQAWVQDAFAGQTGDTDAFAGYHYTSLVQTVDQLNPATATSYAKAGSDDFYMKLFDGFAEDNWKVTPKLNVTIGVRYDVQLTPPPIKNNTNYAPLSTLYSSTIKNVTDRVQPRVGFSYSPMTGTVVRGGYGIFSALNQGSTYYAMRVENGVVQVNYNYNGCGAVACAATFVRPGVQFPNVPFYPTGPSINGALHPAGGAIPQVLGSAGSGVQSFHGLDPNFVPPLTHEADFAIEQQIPGKMTVSVGYVGSRALRLPVFLDANLIGQTPHGSRSYFVQNAASQTQRTLTVPVYLTTDRINQNLQSYNTGFSVANSWYNSLAATVRRPFSNGLEVIMNYTWSRATDTDQVQGAFGTFYGGNPVLDPNNVRGENGLSDIDVRHRWVASVVYQPRVFEGNKVMKYLVDDFVFSATDIASAGQPIVAGLSGTVFNGSATSYGADGNIYGGSMSSGSGLATSGRSPIIGRNSIIGPGFNNLDLRVARNVKVYDKYEMQFSVDAFNAINHTIVQGVQSNYSSYVAASATSATCNTTTAGTPSPLQGCITPYTGTGLSAFGTTSSTNSILYGPRQLQLAAKFNF